MEIEVFEKLLRLIVMIATPCLLSSFLVRFAYFSSKGSISNELKLFIGFQYLMPISKSKTSENGNHSIISIINLLLKISYVLLVIMAILMIILAVTNGLN